MTDEELPRLAQLPASCCGRAIVRFDLPSRIPGLFVEDAARHGWRQRANGEWLCHEHIVPAHLKAIVDHAAGRVHSDGGAVMRCLAEVLAVHEKDVLSAAAERIRARAYADKAKFPQHSDGRVGLLSAAHMIDPEGDGRG